jgi:hypothetical protein
MNKKNGVWIQENEAENMEQLNVVEMFPHQIPWEEINEDLLPR